MNIKLLGIVNITPDSFSDGGLAYTPDLALARIESLLADGADGIDLGAESTRPGAQSLDAAEEWHRLQPVMAAAITLCHAKNAVLSVDTRHVATAEKALALGADWINDVGGFSDEDMIRTAASSQCHLVLMHALTIPADSSITLPEECDPVEVVRDFFTGQLARLEAYGIAHRRILCDPGIGFGKTPEQSLKLLLGVKDLSPLPLLVGHSRKSFLTLFGKHSPDVRDDLTLAFSAMLAQSQVEWLRVHDVARHKALIERLA